MREMKDSNVSWMKMVPADWEIKRIKHLFSILSGATPKSEISEYWDGEVLWITPADYKTIDRYVNRGKRNITQAGLKSCSATMIPAGSLIFSKRAPIGTVSINSVPLSTNQGCLSCVDKIGCNTVFYYYVMSICTESFELLGSGTTFKEISANSFANFPVPFPSFIEQKIIVDFLNEKCSEIDAQVADIQAQIDVLEQYKRSVITEAVTKGLDPVAAMKDSGIEWCMEIPRHWKIMPNKYLMKKKKIICPVYDGEDILSLTMNGVIVRDLDAGGKMPTTFNGYQRTTVGNLLMCLFDIDVTPRCIGLIKNEGLTSPAYSQFQVNDEGYAPYYYYYYLMLDFTKELLHMAKNLRHSLTEDQLGAISVPVPPVSEQMDIANYLDEKCRGIDAVIADKQTQLATLDEYKKSLIFEYVTGKKEVTA